MEKISTGGRQGELCAGKGRKCSRDGENLAQEWQTPARLACAVRVTGSAGERNRICRLNALYLGGLCHQKGPVAGVGALAGEGAEARVLRPFVEVAGVWLQ